MKKKNLFWILCVVVAFLGFGLFSQKYALFDSQTEEMRQKSDSENQNKKMAADKDKAQSETTDDFPSVFKKREGKVTFDAEIEKPDNLKRSSLKKYDISFQRYDFKKAYEQFFSKQKLLQKTEDFSKKTDKVAFYEAANGANLTLNEDSAMLILPFSMYINRCFDLNTDSSKFPVNQSFDFMSGEEAAARLKQSLDTIGFYLGQEYYCKWYQLSHDKLKENEYAIDQDGNIDKSRYKPSWSKKDDCYYLIIYQTCQGVKIHTYYDNYMVMMRDATAPVQAIYSKEGIQYLDFTKSFELKQGQGSYHLKSWYEIADMLLEKYNQILGESYYEFYKVQFVFLTQEKNGQFQLRPVWIIDGVEKEEGIEEESRFQIAIDGETGEGLY